MTPDPLPTCTRCGQPFVVPPTLQEKYKGWVPKTCLACWKREQSPTSKRPPPSSPPSGTAAVTGTRIGAARELLLTVAEVLQRFHKGPKDGVFTDGACTGNPGPGGWGCVLVKSNQVVAQRHGSAPHTTNNRMELTAIINGYQLLPANARVTLWSDSQLCVNTITTWAAGWQARGWRRKTGPIKNLELVKEAYALAQAQPHVTLRWIRAHDGSRWNEYADALATAYLRDTL